MARGTARYAIAVGTAACAWLLSATASAQALNPHGPRYERGFGNRDSFVFSVEQVFGFEHLELGWHDGEGHDVNASIDAKPMAPPYWGDVGLFSVSKSGLTLGTLLGFTHVFMRIDETLIRFKPRIGYAGAATPGFGYWLRAGPSLFATFGGSHNHAYTLAVGGEAYAVVTPYPHFGILLGPNFDINLIGRDQDGNSRKLSQYGVTAGLMGELW